MIKINRKDADFILDFCKVVLETYSALVRGYDEIFEKAFNQLVEANKDNKDFDIESARAFSDNSGKAMLLETVKAYKEIIKTFEGSGNITLTEHEADKIAVFFRNKMQEELAMDEITEEDKEISNAARKYVIEGYEEKIDDTEYDDHKTEARIIELLMVGSDD